MIIATTTEAGTDEDTEAAGRVTRQIIDSFLKRPSLSDHAINAVAAMANNDLSMMNLDGELPIGCDASFIFLERNQARFLVAGNAAAWHFENGRLAHRSEAGTAPLIGTGPHYKPRLEPVFALNREENAFLVASPTLAASLKDADLEEALNKSKSPEEWMEQLKTMVGLDKQFCAISVFLPVAKPSLLRELFLRA